MDSDIDPDLVRLDGGGTKQYAIQSRAADTLRPWKFDRMLAKSRTQSEAWYSDFLEYDTEPGTEYRMVRMNVQVTITPVKGD